MLAVVNEQQPLPEIVGSGTLDGVTRAFNGSSRGICVERVMTVKSEV